MKKLSQLEKINQEVFKRLAADSGGKLVKSYRGCEIREVSDGSYSIYKNGKQMDSGFSSVADAVNEIDKMQA